MAITSRHPLRLRRQSQRPGLSYQERHPYEELRQRVAPRLGIAGDTLMLAPYPEPDGARADPQAVVAFVRTAQR
ncbi:MAG: hypothetical protein H0U97_19690 [Gammaproteobacteria bacterium]|nr:hypothetical protein [Gammaproteobacteria bacterium]